MELKRDVGVKSVKDVKEDKEGEEALLESRVVQLLSEDGITVTIKGNPDHLQGFRTGAKVTLVVKDLQRKLPLEGT
jgi:hypothetical protein